MYSEYCINKQPKLRKSTFWYLGCLVLMSCITACSTPAQRLDKRAEDYGMQRRVLLGDAFNHIAYVKISRPESHRLHVYIEGDGRPWLGGKYISKDPTTKRPLALSLAKLDPENVLYLGRPCYMGLEQDGICNEKYWTSARYSAAVTASMSAALKQVVDEYDIRVTSLIGYSGGGSLAMLMASDTYAPIIPTLESVVTLSANLDVAAWVKMHRYLPLSESLDPMQLGYTSGINFLHYSGAEDDNIPPSHLLKFVEKHGGQYKIFDDADHSCCWVELWPELLAQEVEPLGRVAE
jgi:hypothetical protein